ncbi:MAG TPA: PHB depolymerase family esterase [Caulobacteraceae bacterium]|nr:PHB depolymerase family esterase [Caulobacteraceae bacterium]
MTEGVQGFRRGRFVWLAASAGALLTAAAAAPAMAQPVAQPGGPAAEAPGAGVLRRNTISVDGQDRDYYYYVPASADRFGFNQVVYALHDDGETAQRFAQQSGWTRAADAGGFVVVFPEALQKTWGPSAGGEDAYIEAVRAHAITHMSLPGPGGGAMGAAMGGPPPDEGAGPRRGGEGEGAGAGPRRDGGAEGGAGEGPRRGGMMRIRTWAPFQYLTGVGAGASLAQSVAMNHPGLFAAVATVNGGAFDEAYAKGQEPAEGAYLHVWPGKALTPISRQQKQDVPVAVWLIGAGPADSRQADYWRHADRAGPTGASETFGGYSTTVYAAPGNPAQEVRVTALPAGARFDDNLASTIWDDFFAHVARWTSSPNGDLGRMLTKAEVAKRFDLRTVQVGDLPYTYYVKTPPAFRDGAAPLPVVISAHGFGFPAWMYLSQIKMHEVGDKEGFITVYLQGRQNAWSFDDPEGPDSQYIQKVVADVEANYRADPRRVYMQGFSIGSGLTYMMGLTHPQIFAAVSPNSGIGPMPKAVEERIGEIEAKGDARMPLMLVYGTADHGGTVDGEIPAKGVLQGALDEVKAYDHIATPDTARPFHSPTGPSYDILVPRGAHAPGGVDARYPQGRFQTYDYASDERPPRDLLKFVWVLDLTHGGDPRQAQLEWDYFKHWRRNADGSLAWSPN